VTVSTPHPPHRGPFLPVRVVIATLVIGCFAFTGAGLAFVNLCDGGYSLILFGVGMAFLAALIYRVGAWATIIPFAIIVLSLIGGGLYGLDVAGCSL
jgi:hypothetical protein